MPKNSLILSVILGGLSFASVQAQGPTSPFEPQMESWLMIAKGGDRYRDHDDDDDHHRHERHGDDADAAYPSPGHSPGHSPMPSPVQSPGITIPRNDQPNFKEQLYRQRQEAQQ